MQENVLHIKHQFNGLDFLGSRGFGEVLRDLILQDIEMERRVVLDFEGIVGISHAFADEVFGLLFVKIGLEKIKQFLKITNAVQIIKDLANFAILDRKKFQSAQSF